MAKLDPEEHRRIMEEGRAAHQKLQSTIDRVEAKLAAAREYEERRRARLRRLTFGLLGR